MKKNRMLLTVLTAALLLSVISCGSETSGQTETQPSVPDTETAAETEDPNPAHAFLPAGLDFGGQDFSILDAQNINAGDTDNEVTYLPDDITPGDIIAEAVYERTRMCEETLNLHIVSEKIDYSGLQKAMTDAAVSGDAPFSAVCGRVSVLAMGVTSGYLYDLRGMETLDLSHPWWDQNVNASMTISGKQYMAAGDINYYDDYAILCMCFNKKLFADQDIEAPYQAVLDGKWDYERFYQIVNGAAVDVDGDGKFNEKDNYGFIANTGFLATALVGCGETLSIPDENGMYALNRSESMVSKALSLLERFGKNDSFLIEERKLGYDKGDLLFPNSQALMTQALVGSIVGFRQSMTDDFGILPFPKYDAEQKDYIGSISQHWASAYAVPVSCRNIETTGYVLDVMGCFSGDTVTEAVIEKNVMTKTSRDEESVDMLRLIFKSKTFDPDLVYGWGIYGMWGDIVNSGKTDSVVSKLEKTENSIIKNITKFYEAIEAQE